MAKKFRFTREEVVHVAWVIEQYQGRKVSEETDRLVLEVCDKFAPTTPDGGGEVERGITVTLNKAQLSVLSLDSNGKPKVELLS